VSIETIAMRNESSVEEGGLLRQAADRLFPVVVRAASVATRPLVSPRFGQGFELDRVGSRGRRAITRFGS
jgi:hypothetical protein